MHIATVNIAGEERIAAVENGKYIDLNIACRLLMQNKGQARAEQIADVHIPPNMIGFLQGRESSMSLAKESIAFVKSQTFSNPINRKLYYEGEEVGLESPIQKPEKIICVGQNYMDHIKEMGSKIPENPVLFAKYNNTINAHGKPVIKPKVSDSLDHEAELAVIIGKRGRHIPQDEAMDYVAGYTVANDVTVREFQKRTHQWLQGKTFETTLPLGPHLVTTESLPDPHNCNITLTLNGVERQSSNTKHLVFTVPFLISTLSEIMTLEIGDVICTGTPGGVGHARNPRSYMQAGDVVRVEIEGIGVLENTIVDE